jgi:hypothetical protein
MSEIPLTDYLGTDVKELLKVAPFSVWGVTRTVEQDLPMMEIWYEFEGHGVEVICDGADRIKTVFLHRGGGEALSEVPFSLGRKEILERYGSPSKSGAVADIPVLGELGAWDRFDLGTATVHIQYRLDRDEIEMVTLMSPDPAR